MGPLYSEAGRGPCVQQALTFFAPSRDDDLKYALRAFLVWKQAIAAVTTITRPSPANCESGGSWLSTTHVDASLTFTPAPWGSGGCGCSSDEIRRQPIRAKRLAEIGPKVALPSHPSG